jgi:hypothetical protein
VSSRRAQNDQLFWSGDVKAAKRACRLGIWKREERSRLLLQCFDATLEITRNSCRASLIIGKVDYVRQLECLDRLCYRERVVANLGMIEFSPSVPAFQLSFATFRLRNGIKMVAEPCQMYATT